MICSIVTPPSASNAPVAECASNEQVGATRASCFGGGPRSASETASFARAFSTSSSSTARGARATAARHSPETASFDEPATALRFDMVSTREAE